MFPLTYTAVVTFINGHFGQGTGPILLDDLTCTGTESRLVDCAHDGIGQYDSCTHADDAGVRCRERKYHMYMYISTTGTTVLFDTMLALYRHSIYVLCM